MLVSVLICGGGGGYFGYLCIRISKTWRYLFGEYILHHIKLNLCHPISASSWFSIYILIIKVVITNGPNNVASLSCFTYLLLSSIEMGVVLSGIDLVIADTFLM